MPQATAFEPWHQKESPTRFSGMHALRGTAPLAAPCTFMPRCFHARKKRRMGDKEAVERAWQHTGP
eukprot:6914931-Prorocentrum_lima.AAC.1